MMQSAEPLRLRDCVYEDIFSTEGLTRLDHDFLAPVRQADPELFDQVCEVRGAVPGALDALALLAPIDRILAIGSQRLLRMVKETFLVELQAYLKPGVRVMGSVASPMQWIMKGICGQCLQWQGDPDTQRRTRCMFSCAGKDPPLLWVDLDNLDARLAQNRLTEQISNHWLTWLLAQGVLPRV